MLNYSRKLIIDEECVHVNMRLEGLWEAAKKLNPPPHMAQKSPNPVFPPNKIKGKCLRSFPRPFKKQFEIILFPPNSNQKLLFSVLIN